MKHECVITFKTDFLTPKFYWQTPLVNKRNRLDNAYILSLCIA